MNLGTQNHPKISPWTPPNPPQDTPGTPPGRTWSQKGFPNSIFDGLGFIFDGFWQDLATNMDRKVIPKHTTAASGLLILYPRPLITQPPSLKLLNGLILKHFLHDSTLHGCNPFMSTTTMHRTLQHSGAARSPHLIGTNASTRIHTC